ncbi:MAG: biosynthetic arginine decarboxylase [SAR324 cluster bacterium]|nr:biosynthetic arginine decarboxylase [SAR324 cluster bacterium]
MSNFKQWNVDDSEALYNIQGWGLGYFEVNGKGHLAACPGGEKQGSIDVLELVEDAASQGLQPPLLIRFSDILAQRIAILRESFATAMASEDYRGGYTCVYPVKVNPQRQVVEEVLRFGARGGIGLEVGSKSELYVALALLEKPGSVVVCNGYKDAAYVRLALQAERLGKKAFLVVEKPNELQLILRVAAEERITPRVGIRIKLVTAGSGRWEDSGGDRSKFGLTPAELVQAVETLREANALPWLRLLHFHLGSQIANIRAIREALREIGRYYSEMRGMGCEVEVLDIGGGLGVDYDGSRTTSGFSVNYGEQEYAGSVVGTLAEICRKDGLPHPHLITESGRALTAHHAMLVVNVLETSALENGIIPGSTGEAGHELNGKMEACLERLSPQSLAADWQEAQFLRDEGGRQFDMGLLSLRQRARSETVFWKIARRVERFMRGHQHAPSELEALQVLLADKYFCNFSVFQSLPDAWAIGQEFPVVPLQRLQERPTRQGILQDITGDSDGKVSTYIGSPAQKHVLPLHPLRPGEPYYLGIFLTGAYQEILGELHNLFGGTSVIHVALNGDGSWRYEQTVHGESIARVLSYVQYQRDNLIDRIDRQVRAGVADGRITPEEGRAIHNMFEAGLDGLPYLEGGRGRSSAGSTRPNLSAG